MSIDLSVLKDLARAKAQKSQHRLAQLRRREAALLAELQSADEMRRSVDAPGEHLHMMRGMGADMLWKAWLVRMKGQLNVELAQVRALIEPIAVEARRDIGRAEATKELQTEEAAARKADARARQLRSIWERGDW